MLPEACGLGQHFQGRFKNSNLARDSSGISFGATSLGVDLRSIPPLCLPRFASRSFGAEGLSCV